MLGRWVAIGSPHYSSFNTDQHIAYISDIGARNWGKPLFIAGSAVAVVVFDVAFVAERWLRHTGRLTQNYNRTEQILVRIHGHMRTRSDDGIMANATVQSIFATIFAIVGAAGLILLTIFDTVRYPHVHDAMLVVFIGGYIISAIFICAEYQRLGIHYREYSILAYSFWIKLAFIFVELALAIAFGVMGNQGHYNRAAVLEWTISLIYIFYIWSFIIDFLPAVKTRHKHNRFPAPLRKQDDEMAMNTEAQGNMMGGPVYTSGGQTQDEGVNGNMQQPVREGQDLYPARLNGGASQNF